MDPETIAPIIDADIMNMALFARNNPAAALIQIRLVASEARRMVRDGAPKEEMYAKLNRIVLLTGGI